LKHYQTTISVRSPEPQSLADLLNEITEALTRFDPGFPGYQGFATKSGALVFIDKETKCSN